MVAGDARAGAPAINAERVVWLADPAAAGDLPATLPTRASEPELDAGGEGRDGRR